MDNGNMTNIQGNTPRMNWEAKDLPTAFKSFKDHAEFMFNGPLHGKDEEVKCNYLMLWTGDKGRQIYTTWQLTDEEKKKLKVHFDKFESYCKPKSNVIYNRFLFKSRTQKDGETFEHFVTDLKLLISDCNYNVGSVDEMIRDHIVFGIRSTKVREKLINEGTELSLQKAMDIGRTYELSQAQLKTMDQPADVNAIRRKATSSKPSGRKKASRPLPSERTPRHTSGHVSKCTNCGNSHDNYACPAKGKTCNFCHKLNHFATVCRSKQTHRRKQQIHEVNDMLSDQCDSSNSDTEYTDKYFIDTVHFDKSKNQAFATVSIGPKATLIKFKVDSGAQVNIIPMSMYTSLGVKGPLQNTNKSLTAYDSTKLKVRGQISLSCTYNGEHSTCDFFIVDTSSSPILGLETCLALNLIKLVLAVQPETTAYTKGQIITKYKDVFSGLGELPGECDIHLRPDATPVVHPPRRVPFAIHDKLKVELNRMVHEKVIVKVTKPTEWVNSLVTVEKANGKLRICLDPKDLNQAVMRPHYPSKSLDDILPDLTGATVFSKLDASNGYWVIKLSPKSSYLTTFNTPFGRYRFLRLPFGINCSQDLFVQKMDECLEGLHGVKVIVDDIVVYGKDMTEHDANLDNLMKRCREMGLKLNADKTEIGQTEIPFFGHLLSSQGLKIDPTKVKAINEMPSPTSKSELETVLGMITYLQRFAPNLAEMTSPLRNLLKKDVEFCWDDMHENALQKIKSVITQQPGQILVYFDPKLDVVLQVDASQNGLGCVLLQNDKPVCFASKSLTSSERNYAQITKELYAILFACKRFHQMVYGRHITVQSDHKPLVAISRKGLHSAPPRLQRMLLQLQKYDIEIVHVPGKLIPLADTLSRRYLSDTYPELCEGMDVHVHSVMSNIPISDQKMSMIKTAIDADSEMQSLKQMIMVGWPDKRSDCPLNLLQFWNYRDELTVIDNVLLKGSKVIIPKACRPNMLDKLHDSHLGVEKCTQRARGIMFWPNMTNDIKTKVLKCPVCLEHRNSNVKEPMIPNQIPDRPWEVVASDIFHWNDTDYVVVVDLYSRYFEVGRLTNMRSQTVIHKIKGFFSSHGIASKLISDNGSQYSSQEFEEFSRSWDFEHVTSSPIYSQGNSVAERCIQTIKKMFTKAKQDGKDPYLSILEYRNTPLSCGKSPAQLLMSRQLRSTLPLTSDQLNPKVQNKTEIRKQMSKSQQKSKNRYDKTSKRLEHLFIGEGVRIKQGKTWKPAIVRKQVNNRSYIVETEDGGSYRRNRRHLLKTHEKPFPVIEPELIPARETVNLPIQTNQSKSGIQQTNTQALPANQTDTRIMTHKEMPLPIEQQQQQAYADDKTSSSDNSQYVTRSGRQVKPPQRLDL